MTKSSSNPWRFYGRREETEKLQTSIQRDHAVGTRLIGRRRIGKTELLNAVISNIRSLPQNQQKPVLFMEIPDTLQSSEDLGKELSRRIQAEGLSDLMVDYDANKPGHYIDSFSRQLSHLVTKGTVVCLDEFHNIEIYNGLVSKLKLIQDENLSTHTPYTGGGFVVAGSHQQNMMRLLGSDKEPLYNRFSFGITLQQLTTASLLQMACDAGWLRDPRRFLTLYSVYGGIPGLWVSFRNYEGRDPNLVCTDYERWRSYFWRFESLRPMLNPEEAYNYKSYIELNPEAENLLYILCAGNLGGVPRTEIFNQPDKIKAFGKYEWQKTVERNLSMLEHHLRMIQGIQSYGPEETTPSRYRIIDNDTRHQLLVQSLGINRQGLSSGKPNVKFAHLLNRTTGHEGLDLERLTAEFFEDQRFQEIGIRACGGLYNVQTIHGPEVDVFAEMADRPFAKAIACKVASCKRNAGKFDTFTNPGSYFENALASLYDLNGLSRPPDVEHLFVAPVFTDAQKGKWKDKGIKALDLPQMARELGFDPGPDLVTEYEPDS